MSSPDVPLFTGSCFCKAVSLRIYTLPRSSYLCHCQDCRRFTGTSFAHNLVFPAQSVSLLSSDSDHSTANDASTRTTTLTKLKSGAGDSVDSQAEDVAAAAAAAVTTEPRALKTFGNPKEGMIKFCAICAGRLLLICSIDNTSMSDCVIVPVGMIDDSETDARLAPRAEFWCKRRESWMPGMDGTKIHN